MGNLETACRRFALLSGITQDADNFAICVHPRGMAGQRRGLLALVTEPTGDHRAFSLDACRLVHEVLIQHFYTDNSLSLTSGLLKAIDSANSALIEHNYSQEPPQAEGERGAIGIAGSVAIRAGGVRAKRSQVGVTAVLLRPDGEGVYLAQTAPTQVYIVHNLQLSAIPEPLSWKDRPGRLAVTLRRVSDPQEAENGNEDPAPLDEREEELPPMAPPSIPLGSGPGVEVDLLYRRVQPGDLIIVVSSSLARHISRPLAEELFTHGNIDQVTESLYTLAIERGLAQSHACVLQVGVESTVGVDTEYPIMNRSSKVWEREVITPTRSNAQLVSSVAPSGAESLPTIPQADALIVRPDPFQMTKRWLMKLKPAEVARASRENEADEAIDVSKDSEEMGTWMWNAHPVAKLSPEPIQGHNSYQPTQVLLQHTLDVPPYNIDKASRPLEQAELQFDGWEDVPPSIEKIRKDRERRHGSIDGNTARKHDVEHAEDTRTHYSRAERRSGARPNIYPVPTLFDTRDESDDEPLLFPSPRATRPQPGHRALPLNQRVSAWAHGVLPDSLFSMRSIQVRGRSINISPMRALIAAALVIVVGMLIFSIFGMARSPRQGKVNQYLAQAQQEDLVANQLSVPPTERQTRLAKVLDLANLALKDDPQSREAALLVKKTEAALDNLQGITRVEAKLIFDLDATGGASSPAEKDAQTAPAAKQLWEIVVQSNDAYVLDTDKGKVFRCSIATRDCAVILKPGDDIGGQNVGALLAITFRVGNLVALDANLVSYVFATDTSSWEAQQLGGAEGMDKPTGIASYDGNLYLLAAKPSQISKYPTGGYGQPPVDWITDPASVDQVKDPVSISIDGTVYVLLSDGKILTLQGGKVVRTLETKTGAAASLPLQLFTSTDTQDLYLLNPTAGSISRITKEGQIRGTFKPGKESGIKSLSGMTVDEGSNKLYMIAGGKVYEASLQAPTAKPK